MTRVRFAAALAAVLVVLVPAFAEKPAEEKAKGAMPSLSDAAAWANTKAPTEKELKGKVLVVHFWAFGAGYGRENFATYSKWDADFKDKGALVLGVYSRGPRGAVVNPREFDGKLPTLEQLMAKAKAEGVTFPTAFDTDERKVGAAWKVTYPSTIFLIDKKGQLRYRWTGNLTLKNGDAEKDLRQKIESLLEEKP
jgi:hypothetical protein